MKRNAKLRILIWSIVIALLLLLTFSAVVIHNRLPSRPTDKATPVTEPLEIFHEETAASMSAVLAKDAEVFAIPSENATCLATLSSGTEVTFSRQESVNGQPWVHIFSPTGGWLPQSALIFTGTLASGSQTSDSGTASEPETVVAESAVLVEDAALHTSPSRESRRSSTLDKDTVVTVVRQESINGEIWVYLSTDTATGWLPQSMLLFANNTSDPQASDSGTASEPETVSTAPASP